MPLNISILWCQYDLRLDDNPALQAAISLGDAILPIFIWDPTAEGAWPPGAASQCWLHDSLAKFDVALRLLGSRLIIRQGETLKTLLHLIKETDGNAVFWNRRFEPAIMTRDQEIRTALRARGVIADSFNAQLLFEPSNVQTKSSTPFRVFTPFYRACLALPEPEAPKPAPKSIRTPARWPRSSPLEELGLLPRIPWDAGISNAWTAGECAGASRLENFLRHGLAGYLDTRDRPDLEGTSRLSPYLHFGELSPRRLWHAIRETARLSEQKDFQRRAEGCLRQLIWREFAYHLLFHFPHTDLAPLNQSYEGFPWKDDPAGLRAWQKGMTGYPIVDAGMRQLWTTGWMHNRVRMLVGSFLVKDLLIPWQSGAKWFWDTLVDADLANNTLGWQWVAGCGADASPFFRIFNPVSQGEKFDPHGNYVRQWVPELAKIPDPWIHKPWQAPAAVLHDAGVTIGLTYPRPMVDHAEARKRTLEVFKQWRVT